jgi:hypothetical protein
MIIIKIMIDRRPLYFTDCHAYLHARLHAYLLIARTATLTVMSGHSSRFLSKMDRVITRSRTASARDLLQLSISH